MREPSAASGKETCVPLVKRSFCGQLKATPERWRRDGGGAQPTSRGIVGCGLVVPSRQNEHVVGTELGVFLKRGVRRPEEQRGDKHVVNAMKGVPLGSTPRIQGGETAQKALECHAVSSLDKRTFLRKGQSNGTCGARESINIMITFCSPF